MDTPQKTTFSAHLSWAAMRRHLQGKLSPKESKRVEVHLQHCPRCSSAIIDYIQAEEPQHYKQHMKKLKGNLTSSQNAKKRFFSVFQLKAIRTTTAVVALLIFSFFAFKTVINQQNTKQPLPSESLAVMKKSANVTTTHRKSATKVAQQPTKITVDPEEALPKKEKTVKKPVAKKAEKKSTQPTQETAAAPEKKKEQPETRATQPAAMPKVAEKAPEKRPEAQVPTISSSSEVTAPLPEAKEEVARQEPAPEVVKMKPVPTLQRSAAQRTVSTGGAAQLDTKERVQPTAPLGSSSPTAIPVVGIPVPGNQIRER